MKFSTALIFSLTALASLGAQSQARKPNILFILLDDLGYNDVGYMGQRLIETPNIDSLAQGGKIFTRHYSAAPVSAPARCGLLTGLHAGHAEIRGNDEDASRGDVWSWVAMAADPSLEGQAPMPEHTRTLGHMLQDEGYTTACIGKWGFGAPGSVSEPNAMGFDFFYGSNCQRMAHDYYTPHLYRNRERESIGNEPREMGQKLAQGADPLDVKSYESFNAGVYSPDLLHRESLAFLDTAGVENPFFLWWTTPIPHASLAAPKHLVEYYVDKFGDESPFLGNHYFGCRYPRATYAAMVTYVDSQIGEMVAKLKQRGQYDNTIIVFTSDNGPSAEGGRDVKYFDSAAPHNGAANRIKASLYEGGINVPMFVHYPAGGVNQGSSALLSHFSDWVPTLLELSGSDQQPPTDGVSLVPTLMGRGGQVKHQYLVWQLAQFGGIAAIRDERYKLIVKNIEKTPIFELYDIVKDPKEQVNIYEKKRDIAAKLKKELKNAHTAPKNSKFALPIDKI